MPVVLFLVFAIVIVCVIVYSFMRRKQRREALAAYAQTRAFSFSVKDVLGLQQRMELFALMRKGWGKTLQHVLVGDHGGRQVILFEYTYKTGGGKNTSTHTQFCCTWQLPISVSRLVVRPEGVFDRIGDWFSGCDIDFPGNVEFSNRFVVSGDDEAEVRSVVTARVMDYMLGGDFQCLEIVSDLALLYSRSGNLTAERCQWLLAMAGGLERVMAGRRRLAPGGGGSAVGA